MSDKDSLKSEVREFWDAGSCGEVYAVGVSDLDYYKEHSKVRYDLEPYIRDFAKFHEGSGKDVLEIGVGMGADHHEWAKSMPSSLTGIDLTPLAIKHTKKRFQTFGLTPNVKLGDAEKLAFDDSSFDMVYSFGVLHHSPSTSEAINEVHRVLRPDGITRVMIYHTYSLTGYMLWFRYGLLAGNPFKSLKDIYAEHLESPGTKAYSRNETSALFSMFSEVKINTQLSFGDLLEGAVGQRHPGILLTVAKKICPRWCSKKILKKHDFVMLIEARK
jgi:ubiquinone/menaquinone biosynthesis C-methylase UbiE